jgi:putative ABC transport system permease protein
MPGVTSLALRNLARNRRRTALTLAALMVGVTAVVGIRGFLNGLQYQLVSSVAQGAVGSVIIHRKGWMQSMEAMPLVPNIPLTPDLLARLRAVDGVTAVAGRIQFAGMLSVGDRTLFTAMVGVDGPAELAACPRRGEFVPEGHWLNAPDEALVGMELMEPLGMKVGGSAIVLAPDVDGVSNAVELKVAGTLAAAAQMEKKMVLMPLAAAQQLLRIPGAVTEVVLGVKDLEDVDAVRDRVAAMLGDEMEVVTWKDLATFARDAQAYQNLALGVVSYIFMFIMLVGIANTMLMSVMERVREIGTMLAVGIRRRKVVQMFILEAAFMGVLGALLGALMGFIIVSVLGHVGVVLTVPGASLPQRLEPFVHVGFMARMVALSAVGAVLAALYPARKASLLRPVEALSST